MKKKLAVLVAAAMALSTALAGCGSSSSSAATAETTGADGRETLRVAMSANYAPFDWLQEDDSNGAVLTSNGSYMNGYDVLIAKKVAEELDMDLEITQIDWDGLIMSISSDMVDCAIAGMSITSERAQSVDFTDPYYSADIVLVVDQNSTYASATSLADLAGATLTSSMNTVWYDVLDQVTSATKAPALENFAAMISAVNAGTIDGFTCDTPSAMSLISTNPNLKIVEFADGQGFQVSNEETDLGIACKKGNTELVEKINAVLAGLSQEDRDALMDQAVAAQPASAIQ